VLHGIGRTRGLSDKTLKDPQEIDGGGSVTRQSYKRSFWHGGAVSSTGWMKSLWKIYEGSIQVRLVLEPGKLRFKRVLMLLRELFVLLHAEPRRRP
jgi:hypothetical protein